MGRAFPSWMVVPLSLTLISNYALQGLPSISELSVQFFECEHAPRLMNRCPRLQILDFQNITRKDQDDLMDLLYTRRNNVIAGLKVGGIKMESLKKLFIPSDEFDELVLEEFRGLVDELVDSNLEPRCWKVEI